MSHHPRLVLFAPALLLLAAVLASCQIVLVPVPLPANPSTAASSTTAGIEALAPLPGPQSLPPVHLAIPAIGLDAPVTTMGWEVTTINDEQTTHWVVPTESIGWHVNSAGAGAAGRVVLSGHQVAGSAPLALLAQGAVEPGQEILLTDEAGVVFVYRVVEVTDPIPLTGASAEEEAQAESYAAPSDQALLTLITGWPDFTTTHRVFAVAELVGLQN